MDQSDRSLHDDYPLGDRSRMRRSNSFSSFAGSRPPASTKHQSDLDYATGSSTKATKAFRRYGVPLTGRSAGSKISSGTKPHWK
jgi:hypothetical protein